jgi:hypothetical protein
MKLGNVRAYWPWRNRAEDAYDEFYRQAPPSDPRNLIVNRIREAPEGSIFAVKSDTHTPAVMSAHIKELGRFFGADLVRIVELTGLSMDPSAAPGPDAKEWRDLPYAVVCGFRAEHDPRDAPGIGGHAVALKGAFATFQISAIIREFGFRATKQSGLDSEQVAVAAGIGALNKDGRIVVPGFGSKIHLADLILTDLPVEPVAPIASRQ